MPENSRRKRYADLGTELEKTGGNGQVFVVQHQFNLAGLGGRYTAGQQSVMFPDDLGKTVGGHHQELKVPSGIGT